MKRHTNWRLASWWAPILALVIVDAFPADLPANITFAAMYLAKCDFSTWKTSAKALSNYGNGVFVNYDVEEHPNIFRRKLIWARLHRKKVIINVQSIFFSAGYADSNGAHHDVLYELQPGYRRRWKAFAAVVKQFQDIIYAMMPGDEPYWNASLKGGIPRETVKNTFEYVGMTIKKSFPDLPLMIVHGFPEIDSAFQPFSNFDLIGFDCYGSFDRCGAPIAGIAPDVQPKSIPEWIAQLESRLYSHQKVVLVPDAFLFGEQIESRGAEAGVVDRAKKFVKYAEMDERVSAFVPFTYLSSTTDRETLIGTRDLPAVWRFYKGLLRN
jgi:hypothetical protein